jgi:hypothetical protein
MSASHRTVTTRSPPRLRSASKRCFERDRLMTELLRATAETLAAKEASARFECELAGLRSEAVVASARGLGAESHYHHVRGMPGL